MSCLVLGCRCALLLNTISFNQSNQKFMEANVKEAITLLEGVRPNVVIRAVSSVTTLETKFARFISGKTSVPQKFIDKEKVEKLIDGLKKAKDLTGLVGRDRFSVLVPYIQDALVKRAIDDKLAEFAGLRLNESQQQLLADSMKKYESQLRSFVQTAAVIKQIYDLA